MVDPPLVKCEDPHEDTYHIFFHCKTAIDAWNAANVWHLIAPSLNQFDNAPDIIFDLLQKLSASQVESIVTIMWSIWKSRNLKLWQQVSKSTVTIMERAKHLLEGWRKAHRKQGSLVQLNSPASTGPQTSDGQNAIDRYGPTCWRKPRSGRLKCNVDASFSTSSNKVGIDMCIRDSEGNHVRSKTLWFSPLCPVDIGKALELDHAIRWINELQLTNVDFEVDSKTVADYFNKARGDSTKFGSIMDNNIQFCNIFLRNSHVEFIRRQTNEVAHELHYSLASTSLMIFQCIFDLIFNEMI